MEMGEMMKVTVYCDFDFSSFPFDQQECNISLRERHLTSDIIFNENITLYCKGQMCNEPENGLIKLPDQHGISYQINMKLMGVTNLSFYGDIYSYSYSTIKFSLERNTLGLLIGGFYLPTGLFAFLSLGSYIINPDIVSEISLKYYNQITYLLSDYVFCLQVPGRLGLLITLYLITFNIYGSVSSNIAPPKRGFSYIEVWMLGVMSTINLGILEYFFILAYKRSNKFENLEQITRRIDTISCIISLIFFTFFIILYWMKGLEYF